MAASPAACSVIHAVVCSGSGMGPPSPGAASRWRSAVAGGRGSRPSGVPEIPRRASGTALRRQGRSVARAIGPRHHRPRLRHRTHRRGEASAASRPPQARARVVEKVRQSAQPPADRSVQRLIPRRRWTAPANGWAARARSCPPSARQRARTAATPCLTNLPPKGHSGKHRRRCALPVRLLPLPLYPPQGALRIAYCSK
jgi:hypothetical protein